MPAVRPVAAPAEYEPVATGILEPILRVARWPSEARMRGFCRTRVSALVSSALTVAPPRVTAKSVPLRWARLLRVRFAVVVVPVVVVVVVAVVVVGACAVRPKDCGRVMPRVH